MSFAGSRTRRLFNAKIIAKRPDDRFRFCRIVARLSDRFDETQNDDIKKNT
jgi:hypothetical protein